MNGDEILKILFMGWRVVSAIKNTEEDLGLFPRMHMVIQNHSCRGSRTLFKPP